MTDIEKPEDEASLEEESQPELSDPEQNNSDEINQVEKAAPQNQTEFATTEEELNASSSDEVEVSSEESEDDSTETIQPAPADPQEEKILDDNFEEAYDFESGDLISDDPKDGIPVKHTVSTVKEFFNMEFLYRYDILEDNEREELRGSYQIDLFTGEKKSEREVSSWSFSLGDELEVKNEEASEPIALLSMSSDDFIRLVNGDLNPQLAFLAKRIKPSGNFEAALSVQKILAPMNDFSGKVFR